MSLPVVPMIMPSSTSQSSEVEIFASNGTVSKGPVTAVVALLKNTGHLGSSRLSCSFCAPSSKCSR